MADISEITRQLSYEMADGNMDLALKWLSTMSTFDPAVQSGSIDSPSVGSCLVVEPSSGNVVAEVHHATNAEIEDAISSAVKAAQDWWKMQNDRSKFLKQIADKVTTNELLLAQVESLTRSVQLKDPREFDVPATVDCLRSHALWTASLTAMDEWQPWGVEAAVLAVNSPLVALAWLVVPALAAGNCVVLVVPSEVALPAVLFGQLCRQAGLPPGVLSVVPGNAETISKVTSHGSVLKTTCFGPTGFCREIGESLLSYPDKRLSTIMSGKTPMIVFESGDIQAAAQSALKWAWYNQGAVPWSVRTVYVQEAVLETFIGTLRYHLGYMRVGHAFTKVANVGLPYDKAVSRAVGNYVTEARNSGIRVFMAPFTPEDFKKGFFPPALLVGAEASSSLVMEEENCLPVITVVPFRVAKEAIAMANRTRYGFAASVWTESGSVATHVAEKLQVGTVWVNSHGIFSSSVPIEGWKESGIGTFVGYAGLLEHLHLSNALLRDATVSLATLQLESSVMQVTKPVIDLNAVQEPKKYQLYYGGSYKNSVGNDTRSLQIQSKIFATIANANRKDVRNAVDAAVAAQPKWEANEAIVREKVMHQISTDFVVKKDDLLKLWNKLYVPLPPNSDQMWEKAAEYLKFCAASCSQLHSARVEPNIGNHVVTMYRKPLGVVALGYCDDQINSGVLLVTLLWQVSTAIGFSNSVVVVLDSPNPVPILEVLKVVCGSVPAGVINVLTGSVDMLMTTLTEHECVDAVFLYGCSQVVEAGVRHKACQNMKPVFNAYHWGVSKPCYAAGRLTQHLLTKSKAVWVNRGKNVLV